MTKSFFIIFFLMAMSTQALADKSCFIAKEQNKILEQEGDCATRYAPQSTFKIALSLMGYDAGILETETQPEWAFKPGYYDFPNVCKSAHDPRTWMRDSCVWYSQVLTQQLGMKKFKDYVENFEYGNQDLSGGLTEAWLSSSLLISPQEQVTFIAKLTDNTLPVTAKSLDMTKAILYKEELSGGWKLYGKTGSGADKQGIQQGWFVGWIEKDGRIIQFADHIVDSTVQDSIASFRAREQAKNNLWRIIEALPPAPVYPKVRAEYLRQN